MIQLDTLKLRDTPKSARKPRSVTASRKTVTRTKRVITISGIPKNPSGYVIYEGPSLLDGAPIVVIATVKSRNGKTGNMIQTWIMRADMLPMEASRNGCDISICGSCAHRGKPTFADKGVASERSCYVDLPKAPTNIWQTYQRGRYPRAIGHTAIAAIGRGRKVRVGAYGDGSAVPSYIIDSLLSDCVGHTAYSHQSGNPASSYDPARYMVSADSEAAARAAWAQGARTFRVVADYSDAVPGKEIACPAGTVRGAGSARRVVHCVDCGLCDGTARHPQAKSIVIEVHGAGAVHWQG